MITASVMKGLIFFCFIKSRNENDGNTKFLMKNKSKKNMKKVQIKIQVKIK